MSTTNQIFKNAFSGWLSVLIRAGLAFVMVPFLLSYLGKEGYGIVGLLGVTVSFAAIADLGLRGALSRELTEKISKNDDKGFNELINTALILYVALASVLSLILWLSSPFLVDFFKIPLELQTDTIWILRLYGSISLISSFISPAFSSALASYNRYDINNSVGIIGGILSNIAILIIIPLSPNPIWGWTIIMVVFAFLSTFMTIFAFQRYCKGAIINAKFINIRGLNPLFKLSGNIYIIQLAQTLSDKADPLILSYYKGPDSVALYQPAARLSAMFNPLVMTLSNQLSTVTTTYFTTGNKKRLDDVFLKGTKYTILPGGLISMGVFVFAEPFAKLWLFNSIQDDYLIVSNLMKIYAIIDLFTYSSGTKWPVLLAMKKLNFLTTLLIITAVLNIITSIYFVGYTNHGIAGVLYGTLLSKIIRIVISNIYVVKLLKIKMVEYLRVSFSGPIVCLLFGGIVGTILLKQFDCNSWQSLITLAGITSIVWSVSCWFLGLTTHEKRQVISRLKK